MENRLKIFAVKGFCTNSNHPLSTYPSVLWLLEASCRGPDISEIPGYLPGLIVDPLFFPTLKSEKKSRGARPSNFAATRTHPQNGPQVPS